MPQISKEWISKTKSKIYLNGGYSKKVITLENATIEDLKYLEKIGHPAVIADKKEAVNVDKKESVTPK